ncbi:MAG: BamA/TamA family outer membrane protein [Bacteroidetes bacterium]|nr:BamA/TamA family outer membrane protein [Bacteroidota bacterium]
MIRFRLFINIILIITAIAILASCSSTRKLEENQILLKKNKVISKNYNISKEAINGLIKQTPNKKFLGVKIKLAFYNLARKENPKGFSRFLMKIGEPPVVLDTLLTNITLKKMSLYLDNHGFFNSDVEKIIEYPSKKKAIVTYKIIAAKPYKINEINYIIEDENLNANISSIKENSLLKKGDIYDIEIFEKERERIVTNLKNLGYFAFTKDYLVYKVDSALNNYTMNVTVIVRNPLITSLSNPDSLIKRSHKRYKIRNIYIYPDYNPLLSNTIKIDTVLFDVPQFENKAILNHYYFIHNSEIKIRKKTFSQSIFINSNNYFNLMDVEQTYNRLAELKNFRFINIGFEELNEDSADLKNGEQSLECKIELAKNKANSVSTELEGSNSSGYFGLASNILFQNKNIFKGAEIFSLKLRGVLENQKITITSDKSNLPLFNTFEYGIESSLEIPKFLIPISQERFPKYFKPKTTISAGYNYQKRPDFKRTITNAAFGYDWKLSKYIQIIINPAEINAVKIYPDSAFKATINGLADKRLKYQYTDHLTPDGRISFIYNNQDPNKRRDFTFFRTNFEFAGNTFYLYKKVFDNNRNPEGYYQSFNLIFSQYFRFDFELKGYFYYNSSNFLVARILSGIGLPYGNSKQLPYEKSFVAGGANDIRAWRLRSLGPGSYSDAKAENFDRIGDFSLEFNIEDRFQIYKLLHGALFVDAGNIWLNKRNEIFPGGEISFDKLLNQIAIGAGFGVRLDFSFLLIRVDAAIPLKDPSKSREWVITNSGFRDFVLNFGIGYPF